MRYAAATHRGRVRSHNEDAYLVDVDLGLLVIADGMGGAHSGEVASRIAVESVQDTVARLAQSVSAKVDVLQEAIMDAHSAVQKAGEACACHRGMGTTVVAAWSPPRSQQCYIAHVGDSRAYLVHADTLQQLTEDHTVRQQFLSGQKLKPVALVDLPSRHTLSQAVGRGDWLSPSGMVVPHESGDRLLLCTDGLTGSMSDPEILSVLAGPGSLEALCEMLVTRANRNGGGDNVTVVLAVLGEDEIYT